MAIFVCKFDFFHKSDQITLKQGGCVQKSNLAIFYSQVIFARKNITAIRAMRTFFLHRPFKPYVTFECIFFRLRVSEPNIALNNHWLKNSKVYKIVGLVFTALKSQNSE